MLILNRRVGEKIVIDGNIVVTVTQIDRQRVKIGVEAPRSVTVDRMEVHEAREKEQRERDEAEARRLADDAGELRW